MPTITLNGSDREIPKQLSISELLEFLGINKSGAAIAVNDEIVPRPRYDGHMIKEGDRVEIIKAVGGG